MTRKYNRALIALIPLIAICSCQEDQNPVPQNGVYVAGWNNTTVTYWENGNNNSLGTGRGLSIAIAANDVYVAGYRQTSVGPIATYWKNRASVSLSDFNKSSMAKAIAVSGEVVYIVGYEGNYAMLWKNGVGTPLNSTSDAEAYGIAISGADIYVVGNETSLFNRSVAKYWKNGIPVELSDVSLDSNATSIAIVDNDVFIAGHQGNVAMLWKNGVKIPLTDGVDKAREYALSVSKNDVYVAGYEMIGNTMNAKYWKNGTPVILSSGIVNETATAIAISGEDVYVASIEYKFNGYASYAKYWKNGKSVNLTDRKSDSETNSIVIRF